METAESEAHEFRVGAIDVAGGRPARTRGSRPRSPSPSSQLRGISTWVSSDGLSYLMGPTALAALLLLMHFHFIVERPIWEWVVVFGVVLAANFPCNYVYRAHPTRSLLHLRMLVGAASVTAVIYLSGWGPVLVGAYAILALDAISQDGSEVWPVVTFWSVVAIGVGQLGIAQGWLPTELAQHVANAMVLMGTFVLVFVIRIAAVIMEKKEKAEVSMGLSEDRFRSLIQNSSDTTMVLDVEGVCTYASPAVTDLLSCSPDEMVGLKPADLVHPDERDRVLDYLRDRLQSSQSTALDPVPHDASRRWLVPGRGGGGQSARSAVCGRHTWSTCVTSPSVRSSRPCSPTAPCTTR